MPPPSCLAVPSVSFCTQLDGEGFYGKSTLTFILLSCSPLPSWPKALFLLLKSWWIPGFHPFLLEPNPSGADESEDVLQERQWEIFAMKTRSDWSLLLPQPCWADKGILLPENWWDFSKYAKMKYPVFFWYVTKVAHQSLWRRWMHKEGKEGLLFNRV